MERDSIILMTKADLRDDFPKGQAERMLLDWTAAREAAARAAGGPVGEGPCSSAVPARSPVSPLVPARACMGSVTRHGTASFQTD